MTAVRRQGVGEGQTPEGQHLGAWRLLPSFQTQHPPGRQVTEMTKVGQVASVELGVSCWCLVAGGGGEGAWTQAEAARTSNFSKRDTRNLNFYIMRSLAL